MEYFHKHLANRHYLVMVTAISSNVSVTPPYSHRERERDTQKEREKKLGLSLQGLSLSLIRKCRRLGKPHRQKLRMRTSCFSRIEVAACGCHVRDRSEPLPSDRLGGSVYVRWIRMMIHGGHVGGESCGIGRSSWRVRNGRPLFAGSIKTGLIRCRNTNTTL